MVCNARNDENNMGAFFFLKLQHGEGFKVGSKHINTWVQRYIPGTSLQNNNRNIEIHGHVQQYKHPERKIIIVMSWFDNGCEQRSCGRATVLAKKFLRSSSAYTRKFLRSVKFSSV